jgi:hypothetical protein
VLPPVQEPAKFVFGSGGAKNSRTSARQSTGDFIFAAQADNSDMTGHAQEVSSSAEGI